MKILFVCKYNRLRSKIAEALFNHYNKDKENEVRSAGTRSYFMSPFIVEKAKNILERRNIKVDQEASVMINDYLIKWAEKIIVVANDVDFRQFSKDKVEVWDIEDLDEKDDKAVSMKIEEIERKIIDFVETLERNKNKLKR